MILSDKEIKELIKKGKLKIEPFAESEVTSNGYDVELEDFKIAPREFKLIKSAENIKMPNNLIAIPFLRTTYAFQGLILSQGIIDAGYEGYLKFALTNASENVIKKGQVDEEKRTIHLIFLKMNQENENPFGSKVSEKKNYL